MNAGYDHKSEFEQGREDALHNLPRRLAQTAPYRQGYDRGLGESLEGDNRSDPRPDPRTHPEYWTE